MIAQLGTEKITKEESDESWEFENQIRVDWEEQ